MSHDLLTDEDLAPRTRPASRWKNLFRMEFSGTVGCRRCRTRLTVTKGETLPNHCNVYPSKDVAITAVLYDPPDHDIVYLGPIPIP